MMMILKYLQKMFVSEVRFCDSCVTLYSSVENCYQIKTSRIYRAVGKLEIFIQGFGQPHFSPEYLLSGYFQTKINLFFIFIFLFSFLFLAPFLNCSDNPLISKHNMFSPHTTLRLYYFILFNHEYLENYYISSRGGCGEG